MFLFLTFLSQVIPVKLKIVLDAHYSENSSHQDTLQCLAIFWKKIFWRSVTAMKTFRKRMNCYSLEYDSKRITIVIITKYCFSQCLETLQSTKSPSFPS